MLGERGGAGGMVGGLLWFAVVVKAKIALIVFSAAAAAAATIIVRGRVEGGEQSDGGVTVRGCDLLAPCECSGVITLCAIQQQKTEAKIRELTLRNERNATIEGRGADLLLLSRRLALSAAAVELNLSVRATRSRS